MALEKQPYSIVFRDFTNRNLGRLSLMDRITSYNVCYTKLLRCNEVGECNTAGPTFYMVENGEWVEAK